MESRWLGNECLTNFWGTYEIEEFQFSDGTLDKFRMGLQQ